MNNPMNIPIIGHEENAMCIDCEKEKECVVLQLESYSGPHCMKCAFRAAKKRKPKKEGTDARTS